MVLVDTSVWIDFFLGAEVLHVELLERLLREGEDICTSGVILTEVLQGIRRESDYERTMHYMDSLLYLPSAKSTFIKAADMYRSLRRKGVTIRKPIDCMIAAVALMHDVSLLHNDRDFDQLAAHCGLKVVI